MTKLSVAPAPTSNIIQIEKGKLSPRRSQAVTEGVQILAARLGELIPRDVWEQDLAMRVAYLKNDEKNFIHAQAAAIVALVEGDPTKIPDLVSFQLDAMEERFGVYSRVPEFSVDPESYSAALAAIKSSSASSTSSAPAPDSPPEDPC